MKKIRYGVVGLGHIAQVAVLPAFAHAKENSELAALFSHDPVKRRALAEKYGVPAYPYEEYEAVLRSGLLDAVYIALPNNMHRDFAVKAAENRVHVLCEKPLAIDEDECREMIQAAQKHDVRLMTAYRLHFEPANLFAIAAARAEIGDPRIFNSVFCMQVKPENIRLEREKGGGPVYDIGIYCINAARCLFRDEPVEVFAYAASVDDPRFREVDEMVTVAMKFPGDRLASFTCSFGAADTGWYQLVGTKGEVCVDQAYEYAEGHEVMLTVDGKTTTKEYGKTDQFAPELAYFSRCVQGYREPEPSGREGLADVRVIAAIHRSIVSGKPVRLPPLERRRRPTLRMAIRKPPVRKPALVRVKQAHD